MRHFNAESIDGAVMLLKEHAGQAKIIAGGVDLVSLMKNQVEIPGVLVNIKTIPGLAYIRENAEGLEIGPLTTLQQIEASPVVKNRYPMLAEAARSVAAPQIRNMATLAGNLCQEATCWYYRRPPVTGLTFFCRRKGGNTCPASSGRNVYHSIIGGNKCYAACPSDMAPALVALDASVRIAGGGGERMVPLAELFAELKNNLKQDEIITRLQVPALGPGTRQRFLKFRLRKSIDFAIASVAVTLATEPGAIRDARIVLGGVAPIPYRAGGAESALKGAKIAGALAETAARAALKGARPLKDNAYKIPIAEALVKKSLSELLTAG